MNYQLFTTSTSTFDDEGWLDDSPPSSLFFLFYHLDPSHSFLNRTTVFSWIMYGANHQLTFNDPLTMTLAIQHCIMWRHSPFLDYLYQLTINDPLTLSLTIQHSFMWRHSPFKDYLWYKSPTDDQRLSSDRWLWHWPSNIGSCEELKTHVKRNFSYFYAYKTLSFLYSTESPGNINDATVLWGTVACIFRAPPFVICQRFSRAHSIGQFQACTKKCSNSRPLGLPRLHNWVVRMWYRICTDLLSWIMELLQRFVFPFSYSFFFKFHRWPKFSQTHHRW